MWTKCKQTQYLIAKTVLGKMRWVYVTYVVDADKRKWHFVTLVRPLNLPFGQLSPLCEPACEMRWTSTNWTLEILSRMSLMWPS